jgi:hypothetical protein
MDDKLGDDRPDAIRPNDIKTSAITRDDQLAAGGMKDLATDLPPPQAPDIRDRPAGEYHGQPYGSASVAREGRSWWANTRDRLGALLGDEEARQRLNGIPTPAANEDPRRDDTGWNDPIHPDEPHRDRP